MSQMNSQRVNGFDPDHHYYNHVGEPITLEEWGKLFGQDRTLRKDAIILPDKTQAWLHTVWLGFVDPSIAEARLYGTAIGVDRTWLQIQVYDSEQEAFLGHMSHLEANRFGFHCDLCRLHLDHQD